MIAIAIALRSRMFIDKLGYMPAHIDQSGEVFNGVRVVSKSHQDSRRGWHYHCVCHCGREFTADVYKLKVGICKGCGCVARKHGMFGTPIYFIWNSMKQRCLNSKNHAYTDYGGRGIKVCDRWLSFENFYADMGDRPSTEHSLERKDNDGNYDPGNVIWATAAQQRRNCRNRVQRATVNGETLCIADWAHRLGAKPSAIYARLKSGWDMERAVTTPVRKCIRRTMAS
jgi:hypothetical protein